jgi:uncharacterized phiE125 gp8 family phage protein
MSTVPMPVLATPPAKLAVTLGELKSHARIDNDLQDANLYAWLLSATEEAQFETSRQLINATYDETFNAWPCADAWGDRAFRLHWAPLVSIGSVKYLDTAGTQQTLDPSNYRADLIRAPGRVVFKRSASLPSLYDDSQTIVVRYVAGYGTEMHDVPEPIRQWIIVRVVTSDAFREAFTDRAAHELPGRFVDGLLDRYRLVRVL